MGSLTIENCVFVNVSFANGFVIIGGLGINTKYTVTEVFSNTALGKETIGAVASTSAVTTKIQYQAILNVAVTAGLAAKNAYQANSDGDVECGKDAAGTSASAYTVDVYTYVAVKKTYKYVKAVSITNQALSASITGLKKDTSYFILIIVKADA